MRPKSTVDDDTHTRRARAHARTGELSRFEHLLLEISAAFINPPAGHFDEAIFDALRRIVETLDLDRSTLNLMSIDSGRIEVAHSYSVPGVERTPRMASGPQHWPWAWAQLSANRPVVFERLEDLPPAAAFDRANWHLVGLKSHVTMPMLIAGKLYGGLSFGTVRRERRWPPALLADMRRVAEIFGNAVAHMYAQKELDRALGFERLASRILAAMFLEQSVHEGEGITRGLQEIGAFLRVEWVSLWERVPEHSAFRTVHDWRTTDAAPARDVSGASWLGERLLAGSIVKVGRRTEIAAQAEADAPDLSHLGARSLLAVPIVISETVIGALVIGSAHADRIWPEALVPGVRLLAEVFGSLDARLAAERRKRAAEVEAAQWRERLAHFVRVHTAGEMSAALAHEITQPLGAIENYALAARRRMSDASPDVNRVRTLLDKVIDQASHAGDVVTRMRAMVRRHEIDSKEIDVARTLGDCVEMLKMECELRNIRIEMLPAAALPPVVADEIHLQQVVLNLLRNAMEAVQTLPADAAKSIAVAAGRSGDEEIFVEVADRGPGIADADLERVFESFYSTKPNGLGVGLAICRKLIEAHGGTLTAAHNPGGGALFRLTLPVTPSTG
jgi:signal transduction histidine kinase